MKNILIVTYVFPPYVAVGGYRIIKFCKYLPQFGFNPVILTPAKPNTKAYDENLLKQIDKNIVVYRTTTFEPFRWEKTDVKPAPAVSSSKSAESINEPTSPSFTKRIKTAIKQNISVPDSSLFWIFFGLSDGVKAVKKENIDIILSSSPPQSAHLLASRIAKKTGVPHLVDFRDLWTQNTSYFERNWPDYLQKRDRKYELNVLQRSSGIVVNTDTFGKQLLEKNEFLKKEQIETVTNGVDPDDFTQYLDERKRKDKFSMLYSGSLYGSHRNPDFFLAAIKQWIDHNQSVKDNLLIQFIGNKTPEYEQMVHKFSLEGVVESFDWMSQEELFKKMLSSDLLLLFQGFDPVLNAAIPRKLFEYMITNINILAFAPPGEIPDLIERYQCGNCFSDRDAEPIIAYLDKLYDAWMKNRNDRNETKASLRSMPDLETKTQVKKLADFCHSIIT